MDIYVYIYIYIYITSRAVTIAAQEWCTFLFGLIHFVAALPHPALYGVRIFDVLRACLATAIAHLVDCPDHLKEASSMTQAVAFQEDLALATLTCKERLILLTMSGNVPFTVGDAELVANSIAPKQRAMISKGKPQVDTICLGVVGLLIGL